MHLPDPFNNNVLRSLRGIFSAPRSTCGIIDFGIGAISEPSNHGRVVQIKPQKEMIARTTVSSPLASRGGVTGIDSITSIAGLMPMVAWGMRQAK